MRCFDRHLQEAAGSYADKYRMARSIFMHSDLVTTGEGLPLGLATIKFWDRDKFHGANGLKRRINPTRVPIERRRALAG